MRLVPTYALYGESGDHLLPDVLHCESIPQRSRLYDWEIQPHRHDRFMQILYIRSGTADILFDTRRLRVNGPCALFVPALCAHGFRFSHDVDGSVATIALHQLDSLLERHPGLQPAFAQPRHLVPAADDRGFALLARAVELLLDEFDDARPWRGAALQAALDHALVLLAREIGTATLAVEARATRSAQHVQRFRTLLNECFRDQRDIGFYAARLGITATQLNRVCREELGQSALGVVNLRLVTEAKRDLAYSSLSVKEIAWTLGFSDPAYFSRFFSRQTGASPIEFRTLAHRHFDQGRTAAD